ncbi:MAG: hypothetical protein IKH61_13005 [Bacteroidales bacterium]|nr:hypothetical protein [Bacteroidales bacterium]
MRATDLMIGDWVYCHQPECKGHRIDYIHEADEEVGADGEIYSIDDIDPIPLTPEILLKIGFCTSRKNSMHGYYTGKYNDSLFRCEYMKPTAQSGKVLGIQFLGECGYVSKTFNLPLPKYLHELQHAFKLCGIDNDIEL